MPASSETRRIEIKVTSSGDGELKKVARGLAKINRTTKKTSRSMAGFTAGFGSLLAGISVREITQAADQFQLLEDRITAFTGSAETADKVFKQLQAGAAFVKTSVNSMGQTFNRVALATKELGLNNKQLLGTTIALQQTFRLAGATIAEATGATIQLAQGLSSGQLRGQELRSVLESNVVISSLLAKELGTTTGKLLRFAESGKITSDVVLNALGKNFESLNEKAKALGQTFEQTITIALDKIKSKLNDLNKSLGISKKFAKFAEVVTDNTNLMIAAFAGFGATALVATFTALGGAVSTLAVSMGVLVTSIIYLATQWEKVTLTMSKLWIAFVRGILKTRLLIVKAFTGMGNALKKLFGFNKKDNPLDSLFAKELTNKINTTGKEIDDIDKKLKKLSSGEAKTSISELADEMAKFTQAGKISNGEFSKFNLLILDGSFNMKEYSDAIKSVEIDKLNESFGVGKITLQEYNSKLIEINASINTYGELWDATILGINGGLQEVVDKAGNVAAQMSTATVSAFDKLGDALFEFTKTGKFNFKKFTQGVLDDLLKIIIRARVIAPLAQGLLGGPSINLGAPTGGTSAVGGTLAANGFAPSGSGVSMFASGGIVNGATPFTYSGNKQGIMGEAGPEAILPLSRKNGKLGVASSGVTVNVINNTGGEVKKQERDDGKGGRILDVIINQKIKENISNGSLDSTFGESFGIARRGR